MANDLIRFADKLGKITDPAAVRRIVGKAGQAGKKASLEAAAADLGGDLAMSGLGRGNARLSVGYDAVGSSSVLLKFRGPWALAEKGRKGTKKIYPKKRGGKRAVMTPGGPRAWSTSTPWGGLGTYGDAVEKARREVPKAAFEQFQAEIRKVF